MKAFHKLLVMSSAYRQVAKLRTDTYAVDPDNRLLSRGPRFRLGGEQLRDRALFVSGLLVEHLGGPSVRRMPVGVWNETTRYGDLRTIKTPPMTACIGARCTRSGNGLPHRLRCCSLMRPTVRCTIQRSRTNTPLQALSLLNEVTFVEAARRLGGRMLKDGATSMKRG